MKVKDLITKLKQLDEDSLVVVHGYEGGFDTVTNVSPIKIRLNVNKEWYYGAHESDKENGNCEAVVIYAIKNN